MRKLFILMTVFTLLLLVSSNSFAQLKAKSPGTATALSVILPGVGHIYAGESNTGMYMMGAFAGAMGVAPIAKAFFEALSVPFNPTLPPRPAMGLIRKPIFKRQRHPKRDIY